MLYTLTLEEMQNLAHNIDKRIAIGFTPKKSNDIFGNAYYTAYIDGKTKFPNMDEGINELNRFFMEITKAEWTHIKTVHLELVGEKVWVDKEVEITIVRIGADADGTYITTSSGRTYSTDNLWMKGV